MKYIKYILASVILAGSAVSCNFLEMQPNVIIKNTFYKNESEVRYG